jgi:arylsulfatase A-like enzyme
MKPFSGIQGSMFKVRCSKFGFLLALSFAFCIAHFAPAAIPRPPRNPKPNIIFILADDLGYGDLGCYGQAKIKTPNLDQLAKEGMRFTSFYAGSTVCAPSRATLMTGIHTGHNVIRGNSPNQSLRTNDVTLAQVLDTVGYQCGIIGKWGLGNEGSPGVPSQKGFNEFLGYLDQYHAHDYYTAHLFRYDGRNGFEGTVQFPDNEGGAKGRYTHDVFTKAALNYISINTPQFANRWRPFFLYLAYTIPHANDEEGKRTGNGMQVPSDEPYTRESWPQTEKNKAAMITRLDRDVGRIRDKLHDLKLDDKTAIFFASDNGPHQEGGVDPKFFQSSGPLRGHKRDMYEGGIRVPMIAWWPGKIKAGQTNNAPWAFWDVLPTIAQMADAKPLTNIDGISFLPTLLGRPQTNHHDFLYWEFHERGFQQAARSGDWKAIRPQADESLELYNLASDLSEKTNVAEKNPEVVAKMEKYLKTARSDSAGWPIRRPPNARQAPKKSEQTN